MAAVNNVLIVGGGVGGLCLAIVLKTQGIGVEVVDLDPHPSGSGIGIGPTGLRLLDRYGIASQIVARGTSSNSIFYGDATGKPIADLAYVAKSGNGLPSNVTLSRAALADVLMKNATNAGISILEGVTVDAIEQGETAAKVGLSDGTTRTVDLVVGADGAYSKVRELTFGKELKPEFGGQGVWRWIVPNNIGLTEGMTLKGTTTKFGIFPLPGNEIYAYLMLNLKENIWVTPESTRNLMTELLEEYTEPFAQAIRPTLIESTAYIYRPLETLFVTEPWYRGRSVLIGDAAHTMTPHLASGGVMAVEDAIVLAEELAAEGDLSDALARFMKRRYDRAKFIFDTSVQLSKLEQLGNERYPDYASIRGNALKVLAEPV